MIPQVEVEEVEEEEGEEEEEEEEEEEITSHPDIETLVIFTNRPSTGRLCSSPRLVVGLAVSPL